MGLSDTSCLCITWTHRGEGHRAVECGWLNHEACGSGSMIGGLTHGERGGS